MKKIKVKMCRKCKVEMKSAAGDSDDLGNYEVWLECPVCGRTSDIPKESK